MDLGRGSGAPIDGVEGYCVRLREALKKKGTSRELLRRGAHRDFVCRSPLIATMDSRLPSVAPYFLAAAAVLAWAARRGFACAVSDRRELLALVSVATILVIYGAVFTTSCRVTSVLL